MAHFIEHMLFKGTNKRRSAQIINRLEDVGGELNAYTSKEETVVYAGFLNEYAQRTIELIADLIQHSTFPQAEIDKESAVNISAQGNCIVITKADPQKKRQNIMELFEGYKGEYEPTGIDWGEPVGKEVW